MIFQDYKRLSIEELKDRKRVLKVILLLSVPIILGTVFFTLQDYFNGQPFDLSANLFALVFLFQAIGVYYSFKKIGKELEKRNLED